VFTREISDQVEQIRSASDILDVVSSYLALKRVGKNFKGLCPFHTEKTPSFHVIPEKQIFKCFGCGAGGDVFKFVQMKEALGFREAIEMLAQRGGISLQDRRGSQPARKAGEPSKTDLERVNRWACRWFQKQLCGSDTDAAAARDYVVARGINEDSAREFAIGFAPAGWEALRIAATSAKVPADWLVAAGLLKRREDGSTYDGFRNRLMFPIFDAMNRVVGFGGRALGDDPAKYVNSPQSSLFDKSHCLYGISRAKDAFSKTRTAIVVEGYVDCLLAQQHGFGHTVATLGTALTTEHARLLRRYVDSVTLVFDSDEAGKRAADRSLVVFITERLDVRLSNVPEGKDPADLLVSQGSIAFEAVLTSAIDALEFKWNQVIGRYRDAVSGPDRVSAIEEYLSLVASSTDFGSIDPIQRGLILNQVGKLLGLQSDEVHRQLRIASRRTSPAAGAPGDLRSKAPRARDEATATMRELISALLNAPQLFAQVAPSFDASLICDRELQDIAAAVAEMAVEKTPFSVARLIGRFESEEIARQITDLQLEGERHGEYERTVAMGLARLSVIGHASKRERVLDAWKKSRPEVPLDGEGAIGSETAGAGMGSAAALAIKDNAGRANHFAPLKYLAAPNALGAD